MAEKPSPNRSTQHQVFAWFEPLFQYGSFAPTKMTPHHVHNSRRCRIILTVLPPHYHNCPRDSSTKSSSSIMMLPVDSDPTTLLIAKSPSEHIPIITDVVKELCLERTKEMLVLDVVAMLQALPLAERVDLLSNRSLLETKITFLNTEEPMPTVEVSDIHDTWLQTTDEATWREIFDPEPSSNFGFRYINIETGRAMSASRLMNPTPSSPFLYREDIIWSREEYTGETLREHMRLSLENFMYTHQATLHETDMLSEEWRYSVLTQGQEYEIFWIHPIGYIRSEDYRARAREVSQETSLKLPIPIPSPTPTSSSSPPPQPSPGRKAVAWLRKTQKAYVKKKRRLLRRLTGRWRARRQTNM